MKNEDSFYNLVNKKVEHYNIKGKPIMIMSNILTANSISLNREEFEKHYVNLYDAIVQFERVFEKLPNLIELPKWFKEPAKSVAYKNVDISLKRTNGQMMIISDYKG